MKIKNYICIITIFILTMFIFGCNKIPTENLGKYYSYDYSYLNESSYVELYEHNGEIVMRDDTGACFALRNWNGESFICYPNGDPEWDRIKIKGNITDGLLKLVFCIERYQKSYYEEDGTFKEKVMTYDDDYQTYVFLREGITPTKRKYAIAYYDTLQNEIIATTIDDKITGMPVLRDDSHYFAGWYLTSLYLTKAEEEMTITEDLILYSKWEELTEDNTVVVDFDTKCDIKIESKRAPKNGNITLDEIKRDGYKFLGWYTDENYTTQFTKLGEENLTLHAKWLKYCNVRYIDYDGTILQEELISPSCASEYKGTLPVSYEKDGVKYIFVGWDKEVKIFYDDEDIHAVYSPLYKDENNVYYLLASTKDSYILWDSEATSNETIIIPSEIDGLPVKTVKSHSLNLPNAKKIVIPDTVESIEEGALSGCRSLESLSIPFVGDKRNDENAKILYTLGYIFGTDEIEGINPTTQMVIGLENIQLNRQNSEVEYYIPNKLTEIKVTDSDYIPKYAFSRCSNLTKAVIEKCSKIGSYAFSNCYGLIDITLPNTLTETGYYSFEHCTSLESVALPNSLKQLSSGLFYGCGALANILLPNGLEILNQHCFFKCKKLTSIQLPDTLKTIEMYAFGGSGIIKIDIPSSVKKIGSFAFNDTNIELIFMSSSIEEIENYFLPSSDKCKICCKDSTPFNINLYKSLYPYENNIYYFTENGSNETKTGRWWYYGFDGTPIFINN